MGETESRDACSTAWNELINTVNQGESKLATLILPYGPDVCKSLLGKMKTDGTNEKLGYEDIKAAFYDLRNKVNQQRQEVKNNENQVSELKTKNEQSERENKILESQNYKQLIGLSVGLPAIGIAGAGAVIGLPLLVKLLKGVFTRS